MNCNLNNDNNVFCIYFFPITTTQIDIYIYMYKFKWNIKGIAPRHFLLPSIIRSIDSNYNNNHY